jgi:uncharacterized caspase-like protein
MLARKSLCAEAPAMNRFPFFILLAIALAFVIPLAAKAAPLERRLALVIGNASYKGKALRTAANDAALIAQTLQITGFEVTGGRDLDETGLRQAFRDFAEKLRRSGPNTVAAVYFAGCGLQFEGENYLLPIGADFTDLSDIRSRAVRLSEQTQALAALGPKATFVILDAARASPFWLSDPPASGLAWIEPQTNTLIAFSATPGTVAPDGAQDYSPYALALAEMIREGGLTPAGLFDRVRLRVNELTKGGQLPWDTTNIQTRFKFLERSPDASQRADAPERTAWMRSQAMRSLNAGDAYATALLRDTLDGYAEFLAEYWRDPVAKRIQGLIAVRREALTWRRSYQANTPDAYWTYLERYPHGPHVADAQRLLTQLGAAIALPSKFMRVEYDVPPPLPDELGYVEQGLLSLDDQSFASAPAKPLPIYFLDAPPPELQRLAPPVAASGDHGLPTQRPLSLPTYVNVPSDVMQPAGASALSDVSEAPFANRKSDILPKPQGHVVRLSQPPSAVTADTNNNATDSPPSAVATTPSNVDNGAKPPLAAVQPGPVKEPNGPLEPLLSAPSSTSPVANTSASSGTQSPAASTEGWSTMPAPPELAPPPSQTRRKIGGIPVPVPRPMRRAEPPAGAVVPANGSPRPVATSRVAPVSPAPVAATKPSNAAPAPTTARVIHPQATANSAPVSDRASSPRPLNGTRAAAPRASTQSPSTRPNPLTANSGAAPQQPHARSPSNAPTELVPQAGRPGAAGARKPLPSTTAASGSQGPSSESSTKPQQNPCTVVDGKLNCE